MFNQKVNHYVQDNPSYLNYSISTPLVNPQTIHECGTTINKYIKAAPCDSLPLQTWCSKNVAVESFAMRPIVNSNEYFNDINNYIKDKIEYKELVASGLLNETYEYLDDYGQEPLSSFIQTIRLEVVDKLNKIMANSCNSVSIFKSYNPLVEGFTIIDITMDTYKSKQNTNHFYHNVIFSAVNTTRYNTISFKSRVYQDTSTIRSPWNKAIKEVENSKDVQGNNSKTIMYIGDLSFVNDTTCVLGMEQSCFTNNMSTTGYVLENDVAHSFEQLINKNNLNTPSDINWFKVNSLKNNTYLDNGDYDINGNIKIIDNGPKNLDNLIKEMTNSISKYRQF